MTTLNRLFLLMLVGCIFVTVKSAPIPSPQLVQQDHHQDLQLDSVRNSRQRSRVQPLRSQRVVGYWDSASGELDVQPQRWESGAVTYGIHERYEQMLEQNRKLLELSKMAQLWQSRLQNQQTNIGLKWIFYSALDKTIRYLLWGTFVVNSWPKYSIWAILEQPLLCRSMVWWRSKLHVWSDKYLMPTIRLYRMITSSSIYFIRECAKRYMLYLYISISINIYIYSLCGYYFSRLWFYLFFIMS